ncbi:MAG: glycoside hydrolase family 43 protein [Lachnospiraceae bacterium]
MKKHVFQNPILPGFYPDPSVCRVGEDYYLVTSSFVYYPGLPIFHSRDLVHWEQVGHGIERPEQLDYKNCETSLGLWAPTIRYYKENFYIINTFVSGGREAIRENFIITAKSPKGPWSDPVFIDGADGIDPSIFFDENGRMWYTGNFIYQEPFYEGHHGIYLCELDPETFQFRGERIIVWDGAVTRSKWIEAPHLYKKDGFYYLLVAEGGTFVNHSVMMARASDIKGPYEPCPRNPIVTHRHCSMESPVSVVGHGDLFETQNGEWWMVLLGIRTYQKTHFNTGRETFLIPMRWEEDGWPMADTVDGLVHMQERFPTLERTAILPVSASDSFEDSRLAYGWNMIHPPKERLYSLNERPGYLRLFLRPETMEEISCPSFIGRRQQHKSFLAKTAMEFCPGEGCEECGISLIQDDRYHYSLLVGLKNRRRVLRLYQVMESEKQLIKEIEIPDGRIYLSVFCTGEMYDCYYAFKEGENKLLCKELPADLLSSDVNEGFTGAYMGPYATSNGRKSEAYGDFDWFFYQGIQEG